MELDYLYAMVVFEGEKVQFDMVPTSWLRFNEETDSFFTAYLTPEKNGKYKKRDLDLLNNFIKDCLEPPESWKLYPVDVRGSAGKEIQYNFYKFYSY